MGRGALAGFLGAVVMTAFQRVVEMPLTGRKESYAPASLVTTLLPIAPKGKRSWRRLNYIAHFGVGVSWGVGHGVISTRAGLRGQRAVGAVFAALYASDVLTATALGLYRPWRWTFEDLAVDVIDKLVLAEATGLAFEQLAAEGEAAPA
ncbi:MAG: hypothetical protein H0U12_11820 [Thermoleophilaceae bacterium]|jgi:hypothetical protein|nr:hypothetical protein [Thermoleophilaceae bacterium]